MKTITTAIGNSTRARQGGFTLIELMIAITIAIFLVGGLLLMVQSTRNAFGNQNLLAQLQDNERLAMTFMTEIVESAGYFPDPVNNSSALLPITGVFTNQGQGAFGVFNAAAPDTVTIRYAVAPGDQNLFNCLGRTNTAAAIDVFTDTFAVNTVNGQPQLQCTASSALGTFAPTTVTLVNGVTNLKVLYGVTRNAGASTGSCADTYLNAGQMQSADWLSLCSVNVSITFTNPIPPNNPPTITIQRVIATMSAAGVNS